MLTRPDRSEYADFYANYIARFLMAASPHSCQTSLSPTANCLATLSDEAAAARPQPGKWNVKEILGHLCDAERIQSYRALRFARGDQQELHGFEQDDYVREAHSNERSLSDLLDEFEAVRSRPSLCSGRFHRMSDSDQVLPMEPVTVRAWRISSPVTRNIITTCLKTVWKVGKRRSAAPDA